MKPFRYIPTLAHGLLAALIALSVALVVTGVARADEDEESVHDLGRQTLCLDPSSVTVQLEGLAPGRAKTAGPDLSSVLQAKVKRALDEARVAYTEQASCRGQSAFVALQVRVTALDDQVYTHYGPKALGYALALQVGAFADTAYLKAHHQLPHQRFDAFEEQVYSEAGRAAVRLEAYLPGQTESLLDALSDAWHSDNPRAEQP